MDPGAIAAADYTIEVKTQAGAYTEIKELNSFKPDTATTRATTTTFTSNGDARHLVTEREKTISFEGIRSKDPDDGSRDAGQLIVEELAGYKGLYAFGYLRITSKTWGSDVREFWGTFDVKGGGGGHADAESWGFEFVRDGADIQ
jgi:hypothetical protein